MSAEVPQGGFVDAVPGGLTSLTTPAESITAAAKVLTPARVPSWQAYSHDVLIGATVNDTTDTIPGDLFRRAVQA